jgi:hypothetical protein
MIISTIGLNEFRDAFFRMGRKDNFSYEGKAVLFNYLEEIYDGSTWELDVIALCCDFSEMSFEELKNDYDRENEHESKEDFLEYLNDHTILLEVSEDNFIVQGF